MKKYLVIFVLIFSSINSVGYASYFKLTENKTNNVHYIRVKSRDFVTGDVYIKDSNAENVCSGFSFTTNPTSLNANNISTFAKVKCNDGRLIEMNWTSVSLGQAIDQYKNIYSITGIKRKEYKKNIKKKRAEL